MAQAHIAGTTPYPWPFDGDLSGPGTALLVLARAAGSRPPTPVAQAVGELARGVRSAGGMVVAAITTLPAHRRWPLVATGGADLRHLLDGELADHTAWSGGVDAFYGSDLDLTLRRHGINRLLLCGADLETSVHSAMRGANDRGYECLLVVDACAPADPQLLAPAVSMIEMSGGIFGAVGHTANVLSAFEPLSLAAAAARAPQGEPT